MASLAKNAVSSWEEIDHQEREATTMANTNGDLRLRLSQAAFAFRGYNVTNLGRTPELLAHPVYGDVVATHLRDVSHICSEVIKRPVDLVARVRAGRESSGLEDYAEDVALIVAVEIAHLRLLEEFFGVTLSQARCAFGYSLGESCALIGAGVYEMRDLVRVPLALADDCAELAHQVSLSVLTSRGPVLDFDVVRRLCLEITQQGQGIIDISTYLSPNSLLLMGQNGTLNRFEDLIHQVFPKQVHLRRHQHRYPPLHTPIMWQRNIPNRTAVLLQTTPGGFRAPSLPILSMVTGEASYREFNSRELMHRWVDHPQRLWDIVYKTLADGIRTVIHVGPNPNLLPATFRRLSNNVAAQTNGRNLGSFSRRTLARLVRRPWLTRLLPSWTVLLRAPLVQHIILEDWLLEQKAVKGK
jgi:[acyl-carrier-protein] S-malonyltransferase